MTHLHYQKPDKNYNRRHLMAVASLGASVGGALGVAGPMTFGASLMTGAAAIGVGGFLGSKLLSGMTKTPSMPSVPQTTAQGLPATPTIEQARTNTREDTLDLLRRKNAGTILTTPQGLLDTGQTVGKTLLGA